MHSLTCSSNSSTALDTASSACTFTTYMMSAFKERSDVSMCNTNHAGVLQPTSMPKSSMLVFTASSNSSYNLNDLGSATIEV
jgi:hypothetical protein